MTAETTTENAAPVSDGILLTEVAADKVRTLLDSEGRQQAQRPPVHAARLRGVVVVLPAEVEESVHRVEEDLPAGTEAPGPRLADGGLHGQHHLPRRGVGRRARGHARLPDPRHAQPRREIG